MAQIQVGASSGNIPQVLAQQQQVDLQRQELAMRQQQFQAQQKMAQQKMQMDQQAQGQQNEQAQIDSTLKAINDQEARRQREEQAELERMQKNIELESKYGKGVYKPGKEGVGTWEPRDASGETEEDRSTIRMMSIANMDPEFANKHPREVEWLARADLKDDQLWGNIQDIRKKDAQLDQGEAVGQSLRQMIPSIAPLYDLFSPEQQAAFESVIVGGVASGKSIGETWDELNSTAKRFTMQLARALEDPSAPPAIKSRIDAAIMSYGAKGQTSRDVIDYDAFGKMTNPEPLQMAQKEVARIELVLKQITMMEERAAKGEPLEMMIQWLAQKEGLAIEPKNATPSGLKQLKDAYSLSLDAAKKEHQAAKDATKKGVRLWMFSNPQSKVTQAWGSEYGLVPDQTENPEAAGAWDEWAMEGEEKQPEPEAPPKGKFHTSPESLDAAKKAVRSEDPGLRARAEEFLRKVGAGVGEKPGESKPAPAATPTEQKPQAATKKLPGWWAPTSWRGNNYLQLKYEASPDKEADQYAERVANMSPEEIKKTVEELKDDSRTDATGRSKRVLKALAAMEVI